MSRDRLYLFFAATYLAQGMTGVIYEPLFYLLKDGLALGPGASAAFVWWMTLPLMIKPAFGLLSDLLPIRGLRRRPHAVLACALWAAALLALALSRQFSYARLLTLLISVNVGLVLADVVCDAVMVEQGRLTGRTGKFQAAQIGVLYATIVVTGLGGGWLAAHARPATIFGLAAAFPLLALASCVWLREPEGAPRAVSSAGALGKFLMSRRFWSVGGFIFLWSFAPFLGTAQFYYQSEALKLGPVTIGWLSTIGGLMGAAGAAVYGRLIGRWSLSAWLRASVWGGVALGLLYLVYLGPVSAAVVTAATALAGVGFRLALMDLAARSCPEGAEAAAFAAFMGVFNLAAAGSNMAGGWLFGLLRARFSDYAGLCALVILGAACTALCGLLLPAVSAPLRDDAARA